MPRMMHLSQTNSESKIKPLPNSNPATRNRNRPTLNLGMMRQPTEAQTSETFSYRDYGIEMSRAPVTNLNLKGRSRRYLQLEASSVAKKCDVGIWPDSDEPIAGK